MKHNTLFAAALAFLAVTRPATAAEMTLVRSSRLVSADEAAGGAPSGGMVHDFYATSDADLLSLVTGFSQSVYQHRYGSDSEAPSPDLIAQYPAVGADSFFSMPSSTLMLGGGFAGLGPEKLWADLTDDGPQTNFLFGRLTTAVAGSFSGDFFLRGRETYVQIPFAFTLPEPTGQLRETLVVSDTDPRLPGVDPGPTSPNQPEPILDPFASAPLSAPDTPVSITISRRSRPVTSEEIAGGAPEGYVNDFFVSASTDVIGIRDVALDVSVYQHQRGLDNRSPHPARIESYPALSADSFLTMPGWTATSTGFSSDATGEKVWYDEDDTGSTTEFLFGRLTSDQTGSFSGTMVVRGPAGAVELPFSYLLPGTAEDWALTDSKQTFALNDVPGLAGPAERTAPGEVPEPSTVLLAAIIVSASQLRRIAAPRSARKR